MALALAISVTQPTPWLAAGGLALVVAVAFAVRLAFRRRPTADEQEARRRSLLNAAGRIIAGQVTDVPNTDCLKYQYDVRGVNYTSTQEIAALGNALPEDRWLLLGPVSVKYDLHNPANSIIICEEWSGINKKRIKR